MYYILIRDVFRCVKAILMGETFRNERDKTNIGMLQKLK